MNNLQQLDEALDYLNEKNNIEPVNEGIIQKLLDYKEKKRKEKAQKEKEKKIIEEKGYTDKEYSYCKDELKVWYEAYQEGGVENLIDVMDMYGTCLYYLGIKESEIASAANKYAKANKIGLDDLDLEEYVEEAYGEDSKQMRLIKSDIYVCLADNGGGDNLVYFLKNKKFYLWNHEGWDFEEISYSELLNIGKKSFDISNNSDYSKRYAKAYRAADKDLGYNKLK